MEWFALIIPIIGGILLKVFANKLMRWWEFFIPFAVSVVVIFLGKTVAEKIAVMDTEYWGGWITNVTYYEPWDEEVPCRHPIYRTVTHTDSKGNTYTTQEFAGWQHSYDVDYHGPEWIVEGSNNESISVDQSKYLELKNIFKNSIFKDMHRDYHSIDGDAWVSEYPGGMDILQPITTTHTYENRVAKSRGVYSFKEVDPSKTSVFEYPDRDYFNTSSVLSKSAWPNSDKIDKLNALLGAEKKIRIWVLIWEGNVGREVFYDQMAYWKGGNKNELVICLNVKSAADPVVQWCEVFSWSKSENLKTAIKSYLSIDNSVLDLKEFAKWLEPEVRTKWEKRNWHDFDFLSVEPPMWAIVLIWLFTIGATVGAGYYCLNNGIDND